MKHKKLLLSLILLLSVCMHTLFAEERTYNEIKNVALNFAKTQHKQVVYHVKPKSLYKTKSIKSHTNYEIVNLEPKGWVIVSKDDIAKPVLGYALDKNIDTSKPLPPAFSEWLNSMDKEIGEGKKLRVKQKTFKGEWNRLATEPEIFENNQLNKNEVMEIQTVGPLLGNIAWDQSAPYDAEVVEHTEANVPVGCVATAMVQVMKYWGWPKRGAGSHSYEHETYGRLSANFNTTYNWDVIPERGTMANSELAKISYHAGVSVDMNYSVGSSGANPYKIVPALRKYFHYKAEGLKHKVNMTDTEWHTALKDNLDRNMPVLYSGYGSGGHAFVCDGYRYEDDFRRYYFNWGWGGSFNGLFSLNALKPTAGHDYSKNNLAIFGIQPFEKAHITSPTANSRFTSSNMTIRWDKNSASKVYVWIYDETNNKSIFSEYLTSTSKTITVPTNGERIQINLNSYDASGKFVATERIEVLAQEDSAITKPDYKPTLTAQGTIVNGAEGNFNIVVRIAEFEGGTNSGPVKFSIVKNKNLSIDFDSTTTEQQGASMQNSDWSLEETSSLYLFTHHDSFAPLSSSKVGLSGTLTSPTNAKGAFALDVTILGGNGENNMKNNKDTEVIQYNNLTPQ